MLEAGFDGKPVVVEVGPAVVVGDHTVVRIVMSNPGDEHYYVSSEFGTTRAPLSLFDVRMFSLDKGLVFPELNTSNDGLGRQVTKDDPVDLFPVFAAVDGDIKTVELLLPSLGMVTGVPVVGESQAGYSAAEVVAKAEFVASDPGPFKLQSHTMAADGSSDTKQDEKSTTVTVAGDVTFAVDSDQLSAQADGVLAGVVEQIRKYPSGGDLTITGHTDDVADDVHNQDLSERRAKAVAERLKTLTDLSTWKQSVSGKGESAPRVPNDSDERRQANRRVEINLKPSKPEEGDSGKGNSAVPSSTEAPSPAGPVGKGPEGVNVTVDGKTLRMSIDRVIRIGKYLAGAVALSSEQEVPMQASAFALPSSMQGLGEWIIGGVYSLTLLDGSTRYMEAGYEFPDKGQQPAAMTSLASSVQPGVPMHLPVVWPDTGGDSVTIDIPGGEARGPGRVVARLTDIPVVNG
ncbi:OmpA family protein [Actinomyces viscosus]|uniref:OmpA family protein n=1 Tax=Actinomyces viscosus TaxID=1656 RepID=UPI0028E47642|nr:OmpA family protein [Actinomyces viscosus]